MNFPVLEPYIRIAAVFALPVLGAMLLAWSVTSLYFDLKGSTRRKALDRLRGYETSKLTKAEEESILQQARLSGPGRLDHLFHGIRVIAKVQTMLEQANLPWSAGKFLMNLAAISISASVVFLLIQWRPLVALAIFLSIFFLPVLVINAKRRARMKKLVEQLPEVFELISQSLRAGHSLGSGIQLVGTQLPDPAGTMFSRVFVEQNLGIRIEDSLRNLADRVDQLDLSMFVTAVLIQKQSGGNLTEVLDKIAGVIRDRIKVLGQAKALTAEGRLSGVVLCVLPAVVFLAVGVLNPDYLDVLLRETAGQYMLGAACILQIAGMLIIRKIVNIKV